SLQIQMDELPSMEGAIAALNSMRIREEREQRFFSSSVDPEEAGRCQCDCCPPRDRQETGDYCCASLFSLPLLSKGRDMRDGLLAKMEGLNGHSCITKHPLITECILTDAVVLASAEVFSMLTGETIADENKSLRYGAYRLFIAKTMGTQGKGQTVRLPACFVEAVRQLWPSPTYTGFSCSEVVDV
ncbi:hypothetical protein PMAYCL1PPCAC_04951, partial [Pristionchus mayeri]